MYRTPTSNGGPRSGESSQFAASSRPNASSLYHGSPSAISAYNRPTYLTHPDVSTPTQRTPSGSSVASVAKKHISKSRKSAYDAFDEVSFCHDLASRIAVELSAAHQKSPTPPLPTEDRGWRGSGKASETIDQSSKLLVDSQVQTEKWKEREDQISLEKTFDNEDMSVSDENDSPDQELVVERTEKTKQAAEAFLKRLSERAEGTDDKSEMDLEKQVFSLFGGTREGLENFEEDEGEEIEYEEDEKGHIASHLQSMLRSRDDRQPTRRPMIEEMQTASEERLSSRSNSTERSDEDISEGIDGEISSDEGSFDDASMSEAEKTLNNNEDQVSDMSSEHHSSSPFLHVDSEEGDELDGEPEDRVDSMLSDTGDLKDADLSEKEASAISLSDSQEEGMHSEADLPYINEQPFGNEHREHQPHTYPDPIQSSFVRINDELASPTDNANTPMESYMSEPVIPQSLISDENPIGLPNWSNNATAQIPEGTNLVSALNAGDLESTFDSSIVASADPQDDSATDRFSSPHNLVTTVPPISSGGDFDLLHRPESPDRRSSSTTLSAQQTAAEVPQDSNSFHDSGKLPPIQHSGDLMKLKTIAGRAGKDEEAISSVPSHAGSIQDPQSLTAEKDMEEGALEEQQRNDVQEQQSKESAEKHEEPINTGGNYESSETGLDGVLHEAPLVSHSLTPSQSNTGLLKTDSVPAPIEVEQQEQTKYETTEQSNTELNNTVMSDLDSQASSKLISGEDEEDSKGDTNLVFAEISSSQKYDDLNGKEQRPGSSASSKKVERQYTPPHNLRRSTRRSTSRAPSETSTMITPASRSKADDSRGDTSTRSRKHRPRRSDPNGDLADYIPEGDVSPSTHRRRLRSASVQSVLGEGEESFVSEGLGDTDGKLLDTSILEEDEDAVDSAKTQPSQNESQEPKRKRKAPRKSDEPVMLSQVPSNGKADRNSEQQQIRRAESRKRHKRDYDRRRKRQKRNNTQLEDLKSVEDSSPLPEDRNEEDDRVLDEPSQDPDHAYPDTGGMELKEESGPEDGNEDEIKLSARAKRAARRQKHSEEPSAFPADETTNDPKSDDKESVHQRPSPRRPRRTRNRGRKA